MKILRIEYCDECKWFDEIDYECEELFGKVRVCRHPTHVKHKPVLLHRIEFAKDQMLKVVYPPDSCPLEEE